MEFYPGYQCVLSTSGPRCRDKVVVVPLTQPYFHFERQPFPGQQVPGLPDILGAFLPNYEHKYVIFVPREPGVKDPNGLNWQLGSANEIVDGEKIHFGEYTIRVWFQQLPATRRLTTPSQGTQKGNMTCLARQVNSHTNMLVSVSWPQYSMIRGYQLHKYKSHALWLPGPPENGRAVDEAALQRSYHRARRIGTANTMEVVTFPYGPRRAFTSAVRQLPVYVTIAALLVHTPLHVETLQSCVEIISDAHSIRELRVDFESDLPWNPTRIEAVGFLTTLNFQGVQSEEVSRGVMRILETNNRVRDLRLGGRSLLMANILNWVGGAGLEVDSITVTFMGPQPSNYVLQQIRDFPVPLRTLRLRFSGVPYFPSVRATITAHFRSLQTLELSCPDSQFVHPCGPDCRRYRFLPTAMPMLSTLKIITLPCASVGLADALRLQRDLELEVTPRVGNTMNEVANFLQPGHLGPSQVLSLTFHGARDYAAIEHLRFLWNEVRFMTLTGLSYTSIQAAIAVIPNGVEQLSLVVDMGDSHTSQTLNPSVPDPFPDGLLDEFFVGDWEARNVSPFPQGSIQRLQSLQRLTIHFRRETNEPWRRPALGMGFYNFGLDRMPQLRYFIANEVSVDLKKELVYRNVFNAAFGYEVTVSPYHHE